MQFEFCKPIALPFTFIDELLGYHNFFAYVYLSFFFLILFSILMSDESWSKSCATAIMLNSIIAIFFFIFIPTKIPQAYYHITPGSSSGILAFIRSMDKNLNCFPSLHISNAMSAVYFYNKKRSAPVRLFMWLWFVLIVCSVISTKQHFFWDVVGGMAVSVVNIAILRKCGSVGVWKSGLRKYH
jgi:membrane-associated phospholipid phosphatase